MYVDGNGQLRERKLGYDELYPGHIPTSTLQKVFLSIGSAGMSLLDPSRDDMIATLGETTGTWALRSIKEKMEADPTGQRILT
uniref:Ubiquinone biosynthesis protein COQ4-like protein, mitochondrial n=1 Tax=Magallana gigas TaxID=29159 RepID=K1Q2F2_MAGGI